MMKTQFSLLFFFFASQLFAQQKLTGLVTDEQGKALDAVTLSLSQDDKIISMQFADQGKFILSNLNQKQYKLSASLVGYHALIRTFILPQDSLKLIMQQDHQQLKEVGITYRKPLIERKTDRVVFNVENSILASGGNIWDALSKAPGVQTTFDGAVTTNNKMVTVYMDDKPIRLSGDDLAAYLRGLPADNISKIEVMPNPSSKYDAQGGGVINIVSKKIKAQGFNANLTGAYTQGNHSIYNGSGVFNYRKDKLNVFGSYGYADRNTRRNFSGYTIYETPDHYSYWDMHRELLPVAKSNTYRLGADYNLTDNQVFGFLVDGFNGTNSTTGNTVTNIYNEHRLAPDSILHTTNENNSSTHQYSFNLNYKVKLDTNGRSLNVDLDYVPYNTNLDKKVDNFSELPDGSLASNPYHIAMPSTQKINIWSGKIDYDYKLGNAWSLESGLKYTNIATDNQLDFYNLEGALPTLDVTKSDNFRYTERTAAAYTSVSRDLGKWSLKAGLRIENTDTKGYSVLLDSLNKNSYLRFFPTLYVMYKSSADNEFGFTYDKRIDRPNYLQLNPARSYSTPYSFQNGNPFLQPSIFNNAELRYIYKQNYSIAALFTQIDDLTSNVTVQDNVNKTFYDTQENIGRITDIGVELTATSNPVSWWEITSSAQVTRRKQKADYLEGSYSYRNTNIYLRTTHSFVIDKSAGLKAELSAWYQNANQQGILHVARTYDVSGGISKTILNKQGTIRLSAADIFYTNPYLVEVNYLNQHNGTYQRNDTQTFNISFSYKLGKNITAARNRSTASEEERKRTK